MDIRENMFYGFAKVALAISIADGKLDQSEIRFIEKKIEEFDSTKQIDLSLVKIVFHDYIKKGSSLSVKEILANGIHEFHLGDNHLTHELACVFNNVLHGLVLADGKMTADEEEVLQEFLVYLKKRVEIKAG